MSMVNHMMKVCQRNQTTMSFVVFDLNKFKSINDDYGHHEGDFVLAKFAQIMLESFSEYDVIGRLGGDEFVAMVSDRTADEIAIFLERFAVCVNEMNDCLKKPYRIQYSAGVTHFPHDTDKSIEEMIQCADAAMYQQKKKR